MQYPYLTGCPRYYIIRRCNMAFTDEDRLAMDDAASGAENDLAENYDSDQVTILADWWASWFMKAGHKRLARILLQYKSGG